MPSTPLRSWHPLALAMLIVGAVCIIVGIVLIFTGPAAAATTLLVIGVILAAVSGFANKGLLRRRGSDTP